MINIPTWLETVRPIYPDVVSALNDLLNSNEYGYNAVEFLISQNESSPVTIQSLIEYGLQENSIYAFPNIERFKSLNSAALARGAEKMYGDAWNFPTVYPSGTNVYAVQNPPLGLVEWIEAARWMNGRVYNAAKQLMELPGYGLAVFKYIYDLAPDKTWPAWLYEIFATGEALYNQIGYYGERVDYGGYVSNGAINHFPSPDAYYMAIGMEAKTGGPFPVISEFVAFSMREITPVYKNEITVVPDNYTPEGLIVGDVVHEFPVAITPTIVEPVIDPIIEQPMIQEPIIDQPIIQEPIIEQPVIQEPLIEQPIIQEPMNIEIITAVGKLPANIQNLVARIPQTTLEAMYNAHYSSTYAGDTLAVKYGIETAVLVWAILEYFDGIGDMTAVNAIDAFVESNSIILNPFDTDDHIPLTNDPVIVDVPVNLPTTDINMNDPIDDQTNSINVGNSIPGYEEPIISPIGQDVLNDLNASFDNPIVDNPLNPDTYQPPLVQFPENIPSGNPLPGDLSIGDVTDWIRDFDLPGTTENESVADPANNEQTGTVQNNNKTNWTLIVGAAAIGLLLFKNKK